MTHDRVTAPPADVFEPDLHPETLARVLQGLRNLPTSADLPAGDGAPDTVAVPLPRRRP